MISKAGPPARFLFLVIASMTALGIWLTGYNTVHWLLFVPPVALLFAALTGICPSLIIGNLLFGDKKSSSAS